MPKIDAYQDIVRFIDGEIIYDTKKIEMLKRSIKNRRKSKKLYEAKIKELTNENK